MKVTPLGDRTRGVAPTQRESRRTFTTTELPFLSENDLVTVTNDDDVTWDFMWDRKRYLVKPGDHAHIPFPAVVMKMGDPRSMPNQRVRFTDHTGRHGFVQERHEELRRLMARYGVRQESVEDLMAFAPKITVRTVDTGQLVTFPVQDPEMVALPVVDVPSPGHENSDQRRVMDEMRSENAAMRERLEEMQRFMTEKLGGSDDGDADAPVAVPRRAAPDGPPAPVTP